jgi:uncharacterized protein YceK
MRTPLIVLATAAMLVTGCGSSDDATTATTGAAATTAAAAAPATAAATAAVPAAALPDGLAGTWKRDVTAADIERNAANKGTGPGEDPMSPATYQLAIDPDRITAHAPDAFKIPEFAAFSQDGKLEILAYVDVKVGAYCGPDKPQNASYTWTLAGDQLTLATTDDTCADRNSILVGSWTRAS